MDKCENIMLLTGRKDRLSWRKEILSLILFSFLMLSYLLHGSYVVNAIGFKWTDIYYLFALLIIIINALSVIRRRRIKNIISDKYLYILCLILCWGIISAVPSVQSLQSIKNTSSSFLVFLVFYLIPRYFYTLERKKDHYKTLVTTMNIFVTAICLINIMGYSGILEMKAFFPHWTPANSIYLNSNRFGAVIMFTLMLMNCYIIVDNKFRDSWKGKRLLKIYVVVSYALLVTNLLMSSSRAAILGIAIAFVPVLLNIRNALILTPFLPVFLYFLWRNQIASLLFQKMQGSLLSGRAKIWSYTFNEVIKKNPILGIGSGASQDYLSDIFGGLSVHNSYLNSAMSIGLVGFMFWVFVLISLFLSALKSGKYKYVYIFTILGIMAYSFFEVSLFSGVGLGMSVFWSFVLKIETVNGRIMRNEENDACTSFISHVPKTLQ